MAEPGDIFTADAFEETGGGPLYLQLQRLIAGAKEKIAAHIEHGGRFSRANLREPAVDRDRPAAERGPARDGAAAARQPELNKPGPERTRGR